MLSQAQIHFYSEVILVLFLLRHSSGISAPNNQDLQCFAVSHKTGTFRLRFLHLEHPKPSSDSSLYCRKCNEISFPRKPESRGTLNPLESRKKTVKVLSALELATFEQHVITLESCDPLTLGISPSPREKFWFVFTVFYATHFHILVPRTKEPRITVQGINSANVQKTGK